jgi:hypothetical protein
MGVNLKAAILLAAFTATIASTPVKAQVTGQVAYGPGHERYGNTASFFFYDNRDDQRDVPTNGAFPGNFAANPFSAGVGAAGWLGGNPQHQAGPYPSQTYNVDVRGYVTCPHRRLELAADGRRVIRCLTP